MGRKPPDQPHSYLLDKFSDGDITSWSKNSAAYQEYQLRLFHHLESQREFYKDSLYQALCDSQTISIHNKQWVRIVDFKYSHTPLSPIGSLFTGGRFNIGDDLDKNKFPSFPVLYLAQDGETAHKEKFGTTVAANGLTNDELALRKPSSYSYVNVRVNLNNVFDITKAANLNKFVEILGNFSITQELKDMGKSFGYKPPWLIKTTSVLKKSILDPNWSSSSSISDLPSNSQVFGRFVRNAKLTGILYPSVRNPEKTCLAIFVENLSDKDFAELVDTPHPGVAFPRLDSDSWKKMTER